MDDSKLPSFNHFHGIPPRHLMATIGTGRFHCVGRPYIFAFVTLVFSRHFFTFHSLSIILFSVIFGPNESLSIAYVLLTAISQIYFIDEVLKGGIFDAPFIVHWSGPSTVVLTGWLELYTTPTMSASSIDLFFHPSFTRGTPSNVHIPIPAPLGGRHRKPSLSGLAIGCSPPTARTVFSPHTFPHSLRHRIYPTGPAKRDARIVVPTYSRI